MNITASISDMLNPLYTRKLEKTVLSKFLSMLPANKIKENPPLNFFFTESSCMNLRNDSMPFKHIMHLFCLSKGFAKSYEDTYISALKTQH